MTLSVKSAIAELVHGRHLTFEQAHDAMHSIMQGEATDAQIGSYLTALRIKGETTAEVAGSAAAMRAHYVSVPVQHASELIDTCGTGGDGKHTFNISTTAAFIVAGAGGKVAKHGNRAASSKSGSADVLLALGGNLDLTPEQVGACIDEVGIGFLYAIKHHPAMKYAIGPRREIGQRTIFNVLGPLTNPAQATHQLIGVYAPHLTEVMAQVLGDLGSVAAMVVHGADGLDELSTTGVNRVSRWRNGAVETIEFDPLELGLPRANVNELLGGEPAENAAITHDILSGKAQGARRDIALLNAAAALSLEADELADGLARARESLDSGAALRTLEAWVAKTRSYRTA